MYRKQILDNNEREDVIKTSWEIHNLVEASYRANLTIAGEPEWLEKQRMLLADMALHLLQTAMKPGDIELEKLKNNMHAILTIADQFLPDAEFKKATENIYK